VAIITTVDSPLAQWREACPLIARLSTWPNDTLLRKSSEKVIVQGRNCREQFALKIPDNERYRDLTPIEFLYAVDRFNFAQSEQRKCGSRYP